MVLSICIAVVMVVNQVECLFTFFKLIRYRCVYENHVYVRCICGCKSGYLARYVCKLYMWCMCGCGRCPI